MQNVLITSNRDPHLQVLLLSGCRPDIKNNYGDTPLHTAARYGHAGVIRILVSAKCDTSEQNKVRLFLSFSIRGI